MKHPGHLTSHLFGRHSIVAALLAGIIVTAPQLCLTATHQSSRTESTRREGRSESDFPVTFVDVAERAGLTAPITYCGLDQKKYIIETNGCGVAFLDYDNDGWMDLFLLNGTRLEGFPKGKEPTNRLYHNNRDGRFSDVTAKR